MRDVAYIFPGQGSQYIGMGKELYDAYPEAKEVFDKANEILKFDVKKLCFEGPKEDLATSANAQTAIFTHSMAALKVLETIGCFSPKYALGLSMGENSALVACGAIPFETGLMFVRRRGELMDMASQKNPGKMVSILGMTLEQVEDLCKGIGGCEVANLNCPGQVVVSGKATNIELLAGIAKDKGAKRAMMLDVSGGFHSNLMLPAKEKFEKEVEKIVFNTPVYPVISNVTAEPTVDPAVIKQNLITQLTKRTLFEASIRYVASQGITTFVEIGPGNVLRGLIRKIEKSFEVINIEKPEQIEGLKSAEGCIPSNNQS